MLNEPKPQDTQDEPKPVVKPGDELAEEELDNIAGGPTAVEWPTVKPNIAPTPPTISGDTVGKFK